MTSVPAKQVVALDEPSPRDVLAIRFQLASTLISGLVMLTAAAVLVGWWRDVPALKSAFSGLATMKANAAVALLLTGVGLWIYGTRKYTQLRDTALKYCAGAAAFIAFVTTIEHLTGWDLRIDQLLFLDDAAVMFAPGRMGLATAACLMLVNAALLIADTPGRYGLAQALIGGALFVSSLNAVGYSFGLEAFSGLASYGAMAVHMSISILLVCLGFLFARPDEGLMETVIDTGPGGLAIRQLLPIIFLLPLFLAYLSWQGVRGGWYEAGFAMALFVALTINVLSYAVWAGGHLLRGFDRERRSAEVERLRSEERLRRAVADAPVPMVIHDDTGGILHMSRGWSFYSGYRSTDTPTLAAWTERADPKSETGVAGYFSGLTTARETVNGGEWTISANGGEERIWEFSTTPLGDMGTERRAFVTMAVDVTDRKHAEADLRKMNEGLEHRIAERTTELTRANDALKRQSDQLKEQATLLDIVRDGILVRDLYGTIVYWNAGAAAMYGWQSKEALGDVSHRLLKADYPTPLADIEKQVMATGEWEGEVIHTTKDGNRVPVQSRWTLTRNDRGAPEGFLEVNRDVTARRRAEASLRDSELRFRAVAETAVEGILSMDEGGTIRYWNPGAERLFGWPAGDAMGQPASIVLPSDVLPAHQASNEGPLVGTTFEVTGRRRDGSSFPLELSLTAWTNTQGARLFTGIARDVTERKDAERALEMKADELSRSNQELEQFAYVASHDLQEPLRMVSNYTQLLGRRYKDKLDSDANEFIDFAVDGAKRMQDLIHDLLQYARVGTRGKEFKPTPAEGIVSDAVANLTTAIEESKAEVVIETLPTLACDASQLAQVFQNLIGNALKFRRPDSHPVVKVSATRGDACWEISIRDNGIGIEPKYFERIFQMFQRLHGRDQYPGTGIGLALCKKIVERHGGRIRVESEAGQGTTFSFTMPDTPPAKA